MVKIRLARAGKKNDLVFKIVAIDSLSKNTGKALALLGTWHPRTKDLKVSKKDIQAWINKGAQVSPTVKKLLTQ